MAHPIIGVLALQGAFARHIAVLKRLGVYAREVRQSKDLVGCHGVILPGGESTVIARLMQESGLDLALCHFAKNHSLFGTCAGAILMAKQVAPACFTPLAVIDMVIERNAYGRQDASFFSQVQIDAPGDEEKWPKSVPAYFIRAPRIMRCEEDVTVLGHCDGFAVLVQQGRHLAATFHPELTDCDTIHNYFLSLVKNSL